MNRISRFILWIVFLSVCLGNGCQQREHVSFWPVNGTIMHTLTWEIPLADSAAVLCVVDGAWILPEPPVNVKTDVSIASYDQPDPDTCPETLGRVDQVAVHDMTAEAVLTGSRDAVLQALLVDPVVDDVAAAEKMMDTLLALQKDYLGYIR